ncbi:MAG: hypothetical protein H6822_11175 [Planctomycetaceae bacterium]|nr:hypothetical protein [Planctomycetales bacterium]MCB9922736.1 hypothetical protein [Planctomycetaceae bacterium]
MSQRSPSQLFVLLLLVASMGAGMLVSTYLGTPRGVESNRADSTNVSSLVAESP